MLKFKPLALLTAATIAGASVYAQEILIASNVVAPGHRYYGADYNPRISGWQIRYERGNPSDTYARTGGSPDTLGLEFLLTGTGATFSNLREGDMWFAAAGDQYMLSFNSSPLSEKFVKRLTGDGLSCTPLIVEDMVSHEEAASNDPLFVFPFTIPVTTATGLRVSDTGNISVSSCSPGSHFLNSSVELPVSIASPDDFQDARIARSALGAWVSYLVDSTDDKLYFTRNLGSWEDPNWETPVLVTDKILFANPTDNRNYDIDSTPYGTRLVYTTKPEAPNFHYGIHVVADSTGVTSEGFTGTVYSDTLISHSPEILMRGPDNEDVFVAYETTNGSGDQLIAVENNNSLVITVDGDLPTLEMDAQGNVWLFYVRSSNLYARKVAAGGDSLTCATALTIPCGDSAFLPGTGSGEKLPCFSSDPVRGQWVEVTTPAQTTATVSVTDHDFSLYAGIGAYNSCSDVSPFTSDCQTNGFAEVIVDNHTNSAVTRVFLVNVHTAANGPEVQVVCEELPATTCAAAVSAVCGNTFDNTFGFMFDGGPDKLPCLASDPVKGYWFEATVPANTQMTVTVIDVDLSSSAGVGSYASCSTALTASNCSDTGEANLVYTTGSNSEVVYFLVNVHEAANPPEVLFTCVP